MNPIPLDSQSGTEDYTRGFNDGYYSALGQIEDTEAKPVERIPDYWTSDHAPVYLDEQPDPAEFDANAADTRASVLAEVVAVLSMATDTSPLMIAAVTTRLCTIVGAPVVAAIVNDDTDEVLSWATGVLEPAARQDRRLRDALTAAASISGFYPPKVARDWFLASNSGLADRSPLEVLRDDPSATSVLAAARRFVAGEA
jgi:hypothetical protein